jgi:YgiT-type zinc finger domain-containing protein
MKTCPRCKSNALEPKFIRYTQEYEGNLLIIDKVPAQICSQCGEIILSEKVADAIQCKIWSDSQPKRVEQVPVYEIA